MASMLGLLEAREASARERVEVLREEAARAVAALAAGEIELDRRVIAREELVEALAVSAAETVAAAEAEDAGETAPTPVPGPVSASVPGAIVPLWREGLSVQVLSLDNQRILNVLQDRPGHEPVRARDIAGALGIEVTVAAKVEGAVEGETPGRARVVAAGGVGRVQCRPQARGLARRRLIRVIIDHWITASLVAVRVS
ncbi:hypothetical protein [Streptomyces sp. NBC_00162]|uniref:hypothetical protein n=1 Tax=Streptomyces sp. NBC_00162 TaxID=2903629 RepID=UPI002AFE190B|nr:hypothetical protein [Streptomyces sp. NBC_00162]